MEYLTLQLRGLSRFCSEIDIEELFVSSILARRGGCSDVKKALYPEIDISMKRNKAGEPLGFAIVRLTRTDAIFSVVELNGMIFCGRKLQILWADHNVAQRCIEVNNICYDASERDIISMLNMHEVSLYVGISSLEVFRKRGEKFCSVVILFDDERSAFSALRTFNRLIHGSQHLGAQYFPSKFRVETEISSKTSMHVYFKSLSFWHFTTESTLREIFSKYGNVADVTIIRSDINDSTLLQEGYGLVIYATSLCSDEKLNLTISAEIALGVAFCEVHMKTVNKTFYFLKKMKSADHETRPLINKNKLHIAHSRDLHTQKPIDGAITKVKSRQFEKFKMYPLDSLSYFLNGRVQASAVQHSVISSHAFGCSSIEPSFSRVLRSIEDFQKLQQGENGSKETVPKTVEPNLIRTSSQILTLKAKYHPSLNHCCQNENYALDSVECTKPVSLFEYSPTSVLSISDTPRYLASERLAAPMQTYPLSANRKGSRRKSAMDFIKKFS